MEFRPNLSRRLQGTEAHVGFGGRNEEGVRSDSRATMSDKLWLRIGSQFVFRVLSEND